jgi:Uma2 family endonuclease
MPMIKAGTKYSYADYLQWDDDQRWELIDGIPYNMIAAPSRIHQRISGNISTLFHNYLIDKNCEVYAAPFDVRLPEKEQDQAEAIFHVVQPDIVIICDEKKVDKQGCKEAPELVVEILSPGTAAKRDRMDKFRLYEQHGVREYWIVDPHNETIEVYLLQENRFAEQQAYTKEDMIAVSIFADCQIDLQHVFHYTFAVE